LNKCIDGGFHEKSLTLFMAETNMGKSLIMASLAVDSMLRNKNVLYITCEMSEDKISERVMSNLFDVNLHDLRLLPKNTFHEKFIKIRKEAQKKIIIKEYPPRAINANHIRNLVKDLEVRKKFKPDIIYVDYLGILLPIFKNKQDNTYLEVKRISEEIRALAVEMAIPFVSAVQTNRKGFGDAEIDLTDISDSIGTAATADVIIGVTQSKEFKEQGKYQWIMLKNRYGINKFGFPVNVDYDKMRITDDEDGNGAPTAASFSKNSTVGGGSNGDKNAVDKAIEETRNVLNKDRKDKFGKTIEFE